MIYKVLLLISLIFTAQAQVVSTEGSGGGNASVVQKVICTKNTSTLNHMKEFYHQIFVKDKGKFDFEKHIRWQILKAQISNVITFSLSSPSPKTCECEIKDNVSAIKEMIRYIKSIKNNAIFCSSVNEAVEFLPTLEKFVDIHE